MDDVVCGMEVEPTQSSVKTEFEGETYYFCSTDCCEEFLQHPEQYTEVEEDEEP